MAIFKNLFRGSENIPAEAPAEQRAAEGLEQKPELRSTHALEAAALIGQMETRTRGSEAFSAGSGRVAKERIFLSGPALAPERQENNLVTFRELFFKSSDLSNLLKEWEAFSPREKGLYRKFFSITDGNLLTAVNIPLTFDEAEKKLKNLLRENGYTELSVAEFRAKEIIEQIKNKRQAEKKKNN
jgi:hypothetical protein